MVNLNIYKGDTVMQVMAILFIAIGLSVMFLMAATSAGTNRKR